LPVFSVPGQTDLMSRVFAGLIIIVAAAYVMYETGLKTKASDYRFMMESIFAQGTQGIVLTDLSGKIILINPYALRLYGFSEAEVQGSNIHLLLPGLETTLSPASASGPVHSRDLHTRKKDGSEFIAHISASSYEADGKT